MDDKQYLEVNYNDFEKINEEFVKCTVSVLSCEQKANGTKFSKQAVEKAKAGLNYAPVIGYFNGEDFEGHGIELTTNEEGIHETVKTIPFGVTNCYK